MSFAEILALAAAEGTIKPQIDPEAAIARLREAGARYAEMLHGPRFAVGDLVTPYPDAQLHGAGTPMLVVEVRNPATLIWDEGEGERPGVCVMHVARNGDLCTHWVESWNLKAWNADEAGK